MYLLDTNVVSETSKQHPNPGVIDWLKKHPKKLLFLSVATLAEIEKGISQSTNPSKKEALQRWSTNLIKENFRDNILNIDRNISRIWGRFLAINDNHPIDALISATAWSQNLIVITRNTKDFESFGIETFNPFN